LDVAGACVATIGDIFFARLAPLPRQTDYPGALGLALGCCLALEIAACALAVVFPRRAKRVGLRKLTDLF
jgi:hypothetical protein